MISGRTEMMVCKATEDDLNVIKLLADAHRQELGFLRRPTLWEAIKRDEIIIALNGQHVIGFVHYHHRRDLQTTLYSVVVAPTHRLNGIGRSLVCSLKAEAQTLGKQAIVLKCPTELPANDFYLRLGFKLLREETGKQRSLNVWQMSPLGETAGGCLMGESNSYTSTI